MISSTPSPKRNLGLDLLRLVAILLVLGRHMRPPPAGSPLRQLWANGGWVGVDLFFVLSGFLVSGLLFREFQRRGRVDIPRFLIRRALRIYPPFYFFLFFTVAASWMFSRPPVLRRLVGEILFLQNYLGALWAHTWSLAVEEHFYLLLAALSWVLLRQAGRCGGRGNPFALIPRLFLLTAIICLAVRMGSALLWPEFSPKRHFYATHLRVDALFFGVLLAYATHFHGLSARLARVPSTVWIGSGILMMSPAFLWTLGRDRWLHVFGMNLFFAGAGCLLLAALRLDTSSSRFLRFLGGLGAASYPVYLWHGPAEYWGWPVLEGLFGPERHGACLAGYVCLALTAGWGVNRLMDGPLMRWRDRRFPGDSASPAAEIMARRSP
jgi:peptidoglycan/LPS O-acetylase OafA/YrhL